MGMIFGWMLRRFSIWRSAALRSSGQ